MKTIVVAMQRLCQSRQACEYWQPRPPQIVGSVAWPSACKTNFVSAVYRERPDKCVV